MKKRYIRVLLSVMIAVCMIPLCTVFAADYSAQAKSVTNLSTPSLSSAYVNNAGTVIQWSRVKGAEKYRVYYKVGNSSWTKITDTTSTSFTWSGAKTGTRYTFTVRCITSDGKAYASGFDSVGKTVTGLSVPKLTSISNTTTGVRLSWGKVSGAAKYRVFRKTAGKGWSSVGTTTSTSYTDKTAKSGIAYSYTVRCISADAKTYTSGYEIAGKTVTFISAPKLTTAYVNNAGTVLKWNKPAGAKKYRVYYKVGNSSWKKIADTTSTSYTWSGAKAGTKYTFTVRCITDNAKAYASSFYPEGKAMYYFSAPKLSSVSNTTSGVQLSWQKVSGAGRYRVFRKTAGGASWSSIGTTTATSFTDKTAKSGTAYSYTVRCISGGSNTYFSGYDASGKSTTFISAPVLSSVYVNNAGTVIQWNKPAGAAKYRIYYRIGNSSWTKIADTTSTSYIWKGAKTGTKYTITVRCITADAKAYASGFYSSGKNVISLSKPKISSIRAINSGTEINWGKVSGAARYRVFRKTAAGSWLSIGTTTSTTFTDKTAKKGTNYTYTIRCISMYALTYLSGYYEEGKSFTALSIPQISSVSAAVNGVQIKWNSVSKAEKYRVYRKTSGGSWVTLTTTTATSYVDKTAKSGYKYYYTVRCVNASCTAYTSGYNTTGKSITFVAAPKITSISATSSGIKLKWGKVNGAAKYKVFRKTANATSWTALGVTAYTNFTDTQAKKGTRYTYTVRCVNSSVTSYTSWFDATGKSATSVSSPATKHDMVQVAEKQLGYSGGRKIWSWAGYSRRVPWCNLFVTWCADQLGYYDSGRIPLYQAPKDSAKWFKSKGLFKNRNYIPKSGDLIFFALQGESYPYHVGIVEKYENGYVYTIEGNLDDVVQKRRYSHRGNVYIYGYATPDYGHN